MKIGDFVRVKEKYSFDIPIRYHYGEVVDININSFKKKEIRLKSDLRYNHDSFIWIDSDKYELVKDEKKIENNVNYTEVI